MLLIYLPEVSPRSEYIFEKIFLHEYGLEYNVTSDIKVFDDHSGEKINYSPQRFKDEFFVKACTLLSENFITKQNIIVKGKEETKILFATDESCDVGFDIFSAVFYMLSRYEEYLPFITDKYGRYNATDSFAYNYSFLQIPVVDKWLNQFKKILQKKFPFLRFESSTFKAIITYDIDVAFKFKGRTIARSAAATIRDLLKLHFRNIKSRSKTLANKINDPWNTYDYLFEIIEKNRLDSVFFFLIGDLSVHDRNLDYQSPVMQELVNKIKAFSEIGIHPSFNSSTNTKLIQKEKLRLEEMAGKKIIKSRQHFLKFTLPETYNALIAAGIEEDYSMGFPYSPGFRAGTSKPFYFYDLKNEKQTNLKLFPVTFMEGNFMQEKPVQREKILTAIFNLIDEVKAVDGTFISIWHNHTVSNTSEYKEWRNIHEQMMQHLLSS